MSESSRSWWILSIATALVAGSPSLPAQGTEFIRGDSNSSGDVDLTDAISTLSCLFTGGICPGCADSADTNDDGVMDISDAISVLGHLFSGGPAPPPPFPAPGFDLTTDDPNVCGDPPAGPVEVVISEIHYHPISEKEEDEFIELHNPGARPVNLQGFTFTKGVEFTFGDVSIPPGGYLVVAKNRAMLSAKYGIANVAGDFGGFLDDGGETIRLKNPQDAVVDEVHYDDGGLWPREADGYGSTLELTDLHGENDSSQAWVASDESAASEWTAFTFTQTAAGNSDELHVLLLSQGECLVDNLQVTVGGQSRLSNGSFESGMSGWLAQGTHRKSFAAAGSAVQGTQALHLVATGRGDTATNRIECNLTSPVSAGQSVTIRGSARWIRGAHFLLVRLHGNAAAQSITLKVPSKEGTPGAANRAAVANRGPDLHSVAHFPVLPTSAQNVRVSAFADDVDGIAAVKLRYRVEPASAETTLDMNDAGQNGDVAAGDGVYSTSIPKQANGKMVAFWIGATDSRGAESRFPAGAPSRLCLIRIGEPNPSSQLDRYHVWMPQATVNALRDAPKMSNEMFDITFVLNNTDIFYNASIRYRGSPFIRSFPPTDPVGGRYAYRIDFGEHQPLKGESEINLDNLEPGRDPTLQREFAAYVFYRELGLPYSEMEFVRLWFNGSDHGVYADVQKVDKGYVEVRFPEDAGGDLHKIDDYFEFDDNLGFSNRDARLTNYGAKKEEYRWNFEKRDTDRDDDFTQVQNLVQRMNAATNYEANVEQAIDPEQWARTFAIRKIIGDWDSFGYNRGKNMYMYRPPIEGRWKLITWDMDFLLGNGAGTSEPLFGGIDPAVNTFLAYAKYRRMYMKAFRELVDGPFTNEFMDPILDETFNLLRTNTSVADPSSIKSYIRQRREYVLSQLPSATLVILTNGGNDFSTSAASVVIEGDAPIEVERFRLNGAALTPTIAGISKWSFTRSIPLGSTTFTVEGLDGANQVIGSDSITVLRVEPCVPSSVEPPSVAGGAGVTLTIRGGGFVPGTTPTVLLASASTESGFDAFYAQRASGFADVNEAAAFLTNPAGATRTLRTEHATISRRTEGGGEIFPTVPFPAPWNTGSVSNLAARYSGYLYVPSAGTRTFGVHSDDGFRLRINGQMVAEYAAPRAPGTTTGTYNFPAAGTYSVQLDWYENGGGDIVQLFQETAGGVRRLLNGGSEITVTLDDPIVVQGTNVQVIDAGTIQATFDLSSAPAGQWTLEITPTQGSVCRLQAAVTVE